MSEMQQGLSLSERFYSGLLGVVFVISNTISLVLLLNVFFAFIGLEIQRLFYWIGVALLHIFTYPKYRLAMPRDKHIMLIVSVVVLIISVSMAILI